MAEHTPTPWHAGEVYHDYHQIVRNRDNDPVAFCNIAGYTKQTGDANVLRIVACVNAFHSPTRTIPTEQITEGLVWVLVSAVRAALTGRLEERRYAQAVLDSLKVEEPE